MTSIELFQVDAFCKELFSGNPAAVCPLEIWPPDELMQNIAAENNLAETAFFVLEGERFRIRWFTPAVEVDLCGHATLAAAHVLFEHKGFRGDTIVFNSRSGELKVTRNGDMLTLDFPVDVWKEIPVTQYMHDWFAVAPVEAYRGKTDLLLIFPSEAAIANINPNLAAIEKHTDLRGVIVSAKGDKVDFVSRFFAPQSGVPEDPATGSAHTTLTPYWSGKLGKKVLQAVQLSKRRGYLTVKDLGERIEISGRAKTYLRGEVVLEGEE